MDTVDLNFSWVIPGKLAGCARPLLGRDLQFLTNQGVRALVRLAQKGEGAFDSGDIAQAGMEDCHEPVSDFTAPGLDQIERVIGFIERCLREGKPVAVSCGEGYGRTGTILSCHFVSQGLTAEEAIDMVRRAERSPYETPAQREAIDDYERHLHR